MIYGDYYSPTTEGYQYFLTIVDDCTCLSWVYCLHAKSNVMSIFLNFYLAIQTQFGTQIKHVHSNHVPELPFPNFFHAKCALPLHLCIDTP